MAKTGRPDNTPPCDDCKKRDRCKNESLACYKFALWVGEGSAVKFPLFRRLSDMPVREIYERISK